MALLHLCRVHLLAVVHAWTRGPSIRKTPSGELGSASEAVKPQNWEVVYHRSHNEWPSQSHFVVGSHGLSQTPAWPLAEVSADVERTLRSPMIRRDIQAVRGPPAEEIYQHLLPADGDEPGDSLIFKGDGEAHGKRETQALDEFRGFPVAGSCIDQAGATPNSRNIPDMKRVHVTDLKLADGSSRQCAELCLSVLHKPCTGYMTTLSGQCATLNSWDYFPSDADGSTHSRCFWRHNFLRDSGELYSGPPVSIPKVIWAFWTNTPHSLGPAPPLAPSGLPVFVDLCVASWRKLNPSYEIRLLNQSSVWSWLNRSDLPESYEKVWIAHQADAIRLALLVKYGGVWIDASTLMLRPLEEILGHDRTLRTFFTYDRQNRNHYDRRVDSNYYVENWFLAAPAQDPLLGRTWECFKTYFSEIVPFSGAPWRTLNETVLFSKLQLEELFSLGIDGYLASHACFFKVLDDDASMNRFWWSSAVRRLDSDAHAYRLFKYFDFDDKWVAQLLQETNVGLRNVLTSKDSFLMKFRGMDRKHLQNLTDWDWWCRRNTFHDVIGTIPLRQPALCDGYVNVRFVVVIIVVVATITAFSLVWVVGVSEGRGSPASGNERGRGK